MGGSLRRFERRCGSALAAQSPFLPGSHIGLPQFAAVQSRAAIRWLQRAEVDSGQEVRHLGDVVAAVEGVT